MKTIFLLAVLITGINAFSAPQPQSERVFNFKFKSIAKPISKKATTKEDAFRLAAKECFTQLTGGRYPGEEKGLDIIDICANPKM